MISVRAMAALGLAATLTHSLPGLRARVRVGPRLLVDVRRPEPDEELADLEHLVLSPCAFRRAVVEARREHAAGRGATSIPIAESVDPAIDIGTPPGGAVYTGGIYRVPLEGRWLWAFATTLDAKQAFRLGQPLVDDAMDSLDVITLGLRPDVATGVNLAFAETVPRPGRGVEAPLLDLLEALLARWSATELLASVDGHVSDQRSR